MKKIITLFILLIATPTIVSAHTLESNSDMGAVMHLDPSDDPVAGETSHIFFDIHDKHNKFSLNDCSCLVVVERDGVTIDSQKLNFERGSDTQGSAILIFPQIGAYHVELQGKPLASANFTPFEIGYDIQVSKTPQPTQVAKQVTQESTQPNRAVVPLVVSAILFIFFAAVIKLIKK